MQADFGHGAVKQEGEAGQITGFLHQIEAKGDAQHEGRHHQCEKQHIDQHITNQGNQQPMDMNLFHSGAQNIAQRRQYCRCDTRYNTGEDHRQQENQQDDAESQQLSPNGRKRQTIELTECLLCGFVCRQYAVQQAVDVVCFLFGGFHGLSRNHRLLRKCGFYRLIESSIILFPDGRHRHHRDAQFAGQRLGINGNTLAFRHIHHVQHQNRRNLHSYEIGQHIKAALQLGGICHDQRQIRIAGGDVVQGDDFFVRAGGERIAARQVGHDHFLRRDLSRCVSAKNSDASRLQLHSSQSGCLATPFISHFIPMINKRHPFILGASL